jgi:transposase
MKKRQQDKLRRERRKHLRHRRLQAPLGQTVRRRLKAIRTYRFWRERLPEQEAARRAANQFQVSDSTIRVWERLYRQSGRKALVPKPCGPQAVATKVPIQIQFLIVALRRLLGWNEKRMAKELAQRQIIKVSHTTVGRIFARYHLPTRTYHSLARRDGIPKRRYEKQAPNWQWHMDFAETRLTDGRKVVIVVLIDDHSRFCLCCQVVPDRRPKRRFRSYRRLGRHSVCRAKSSPTTLGRLRVGLRQARRRSPLRCKAKGSSIV